MIDRLPKLSRTAYIFFYRNELFFPSIIALASFKVATKPTNSSLLSSNSSLYAFLELEITTILSLFLYSSPYLSSTYLFLASASSFFNGTE